MQAAPQEFEVTADGHVFSIRLENRRILVDGEAVAASMEEIGENHYSLLVNQCSYDVVLSGDRAALMVGIDGAQIAVEVKDAKTLLLEKYGGRQSSGSGARSLCAPMPGLVLRVSVQPGDVVTAGQGLLVLEAMKMENELRAHADGVIRHVHVAAGEAVAKNALLVELDHHLPELSKAVR